MCLSELPSQTTHNNSNAPFSKQPFTFFKMAFMFPLSLSLPVWNFSNLKHITAKVPLGDNMENLHAILDVSPFLPLFPTFPPSPHHSANNLIRGIKGDWPTNSGHRLWHPSHSPRAECPWRPVYTHLALSLQPLLTNRLRSAASSLPAS